MSDVKVEDLSPAPFFARFLEDQYARPLTEAEMKAVRGGEGKSPLAQDLVVNKIMADPPEWGGWPFPTNMPPGLPGGPGMPGGPCGPAGGPATTMAYPSDHVGVPL